MLLLLLGGTWKSLVSERRRSLGGKSSLVASHLAALTRPFSTCAIWAHPHVPGLTSPDPKDRVVPSPSFWCRLCISGLES